MKHATAAVLDQIEGLLECLRRQPDLRERSRGVFYYAGKAFLHFHEDIRGVFADVRGQDDWERFCVSDYNQQSQLITRISAILER